MAYRSHILVVDMLGNNWKQVQEDVIDWYQILEPVYKAQEKALVVTV